MRKKNEGLRSAKNQLATYLLFCCFALALLPLISIIVTLIVNGAGGLNAQFFLNDSSDPSSRGGLHALIGTLLITLCCSVVSIPLGILTAIYLTEYSHTGKFGKFMASLIQFFVGIMTGIPSIVAGLFAYTLFTIIALGLGGDATAVRSGFVGALSLVVLMLPTVIKSSEEMLLLVPNELKEASFGLGVPKWLTIIKVVLPTASSSLIMASLLAIARVIGETAPLIVAAGLALNVNFDLFSDVMASLPTFVYQQWSFATKEGDSLAWAGALLLLIIVSCLNLLGKIIAFTFNKRRYIK